MKHSKMDLGEIDYTGILAYIKKINEIIAKK